ncbi:MAG TPA: FAD-dependent monooxygenase [Burkholderiaceae bacterium]|nr:FAD-dependent monooxygenase [Burkholderiaceae bacterium]
MTNGRRERTALIAGGSVAGLFAGSILHREGWRVEVCERAAGGLESRGAGIGTHDELFDAMSRAGARVDSMIGIQVEGRAAYDRSGAEIARHEFAQYLTSWGLLYRRLRTALPDSLYHLNRAVVGLHDIGDAIRVSFADGSFAQADLVVGADGSWSTVRALSNPNEDPTYSGYVAWRGLIDEREMSQRFRERYGRFLNFFTDEDHQLVCYPVAGADDSVAPGRRRFSFLWYRPYAPDELAALLTDADGIRHTHQIPPVRIDPRHVARMRDEAAERLPPDFADFLHRAPHPFLQPIYDLSPSRIAFARIALIGDAACVARPHVGAGVAKAASDAIALAQALRSCASIEEALAQFEAQRRPIGQALVDKGRRLGRCIELPRDHPNHASPLPIDEIIRESAMLLNEKPSRSFTP